MRARDDLEAGEEVLAAEAAAAIAFLEAQREAGAAAQETVTRETRRLKELVIVAGRKYFPQDLELAAVQSHEALKIDSSVAFSEAKKAGQK